MPSLSEPFENQSIKFMLHPKNLNASPIPININPIIKIIIKTLWDFVKKTENIPENLSGMKVKTQFNFLNGREERTSKIPVIKTVTGLFLEIKNIKTNRTKDTRTNKRNLSLQ